MQVPLSLNGPSVFNEGLIPHCGPIESRKSVVVGHRLGGKVVKPPGLTKYHVDGPCFVIQSRKQSPKGALKLATSIEADYEMNLSLGLVRIFLKRPGNEDLVVGSNKKGRVWILHSLGDPIGCTQEPEVKLLGLDCFDKGNSVFSKRKCK